jgi:hypothetical protein
MEHYRVVTHGVRILQCDREHTGIQAQQKRKRTASCRQTSTHFPTIC